MGFAVFVFLAAAAALVCGAVGLSMMPLHRRSFTAMTAEELARYRQGLIIALAGMLPLLLTGIICLTKF